jgi:hypothetical protein
VLATLLDVTRKLIGSTSFNAEEPIPDVYQNMSHKNRLVYYGQVGIREVIILYIMQSVSATHQKFGCSFYFSLS